MMPQGTFDASTGTNIAIPHIPNNMYHGQNPLQFTVRKIHEVFFNYIVPEELYSIS
jgi:hypothetical protein